MNFPDLRLRRVRRTDALRAMFDLEIPGPQKWIWPVFLIPGIGKIEPIDSMPGQNRYSIDMLVKALEPIVAQGIGGILLFGSATNEKDNGGSEAWADNGIVQKAIPIIKRSFPNLVVMTDVCLCAYTNHGHCGPLDGRGNIDNDAAIELLAKVAVSHARAGADVVAPSAMMDGQIAAIRAGLEDENFKETILMAYSTKFCSSLYGPFRDAENSAPCVTANAPANRKTYQASYANPRNALLESALDESEGADILMVKPALFYLDIIAELRTRTDLPIAAYNVSGEYSMIIATAERGWGDQNEMVRESIMAMTRAGCELFISYWAPFYNKIFKE